MSEKECIVSILCTAYNHEAYIRDALDSFVNQKTDFPFEVLVNDDCSSDGTAGIIREYEAKYPGIVRGFYPEKNLFSQGIYIYHEVFYPVARGRYIAKCEGDDYWTDDTKLQQQVDFMLAHPEYAACVHNTTLSYCAGDRPDEPLFRRGEDCDLSIEDVAKGASHCFHTSSVLAKKEIISAPPADLFNAGYSHGFGDHPEALWLIFNGPVHYIDKEMSVYRINSGDSSWSSGVDAQYGKLRRFVEGECETLRAAVKYAPEEHRGTVEHELLEREFELMYIEGRDREQRRPPYDAILRSQPLSYRLNNTLKSYFPALHSLYRRMKGYKE